MCKHTHRKPPCTGPSGCDNVLCLPRTGLPEANRIVLSQKHHTCTLYQTLAPAQPPCPRAGQPCSSAAHLRRFPRRPPGTRRYYRPSNQANIERSDSLLQAFLQSTGGKLLQTQSATRVDPAWGNEAQLDNLILWNIDGNTDTGQAQWIGSATQDHARTCFEIDGDQMLGNA